MIGCLRGTRPVNQGRDVGAMPETASPLSARPLPVRTRGLAAGAVSDLRFLAMLGHASVLLQLCSLIMGDLLERRVDETRELGEQ